MKSSSPSSEFALALAARTGLTDVSRIEALLDTPLIAALVAAADAYVPAAYAAWAAYDAAVPASPAAYAAHHTATVTDRARIAGRSEVAGAVIAAYGHA